MSDISCNDSTESPSPSIYGGPTSPTLINTPLEEFPPPQPAVFSPHPMLQYPQDPQPPLTTSSPSDKCPLNQSTVQSPAMTSPLTPIDPLSTGSSSHQKHAPTASNKTWPPKKRITKRSWMTMKK